MLKTLKLKFNFKFFIKLELETGGTKRKLKKNVSKN